MPSGAEVTHDQSVGVVVVSVGVVVVVSVGVVVVVSVGVVVVVSVGVVVVVSVGVVVVVAVGVVVDEVVVGLPLVVDGHALTPLPWQVVLGGGVGVQALAPLP